MSVILSIIACLGYLVFAVAIVLAIVGVPMAAWVRADNLFALLVASACASYLSHVFGGR